MSFQSVSQGLGETQASGEQEHLLGTIGIFLDQTVGQAAPRVTASNMPVYARWVKNETNGIVYPGFCFAWDTGATYGPGKAVIALAEGDTTLGCGVADPHLSATTGEGCPDNDHFWLIFNGPCQFRFTTGNTLIVEDTLQVGGTGHVIEYSDVTETALGNRDRCGRCLEAVDTAIATGTRFRGYADFRF